MKIPLIVSILALALSAGAVVAMLANPGASDPEESAVAPVVAGPDAELLAEVEALRERVAELEMSPVPTPVERAPAPDGFVTKEDFAAFREEVLAALDGSSLVSSIQVPAFKDTLADTLEEINRDNAVAKADASYQKRVDGIDDRMTKLDASLGLDRRQSHALRSELLAKYEREAEIVRRYHQGEPDEVIGEVKMTDHRMHQEALASILTPEQLERYRTLGWREGGGGK